MAIFSYKKNHRLLFVIFHSVLGYFGGITLYFFTAVLLYALIDIVMNRNRNEEALLWAAYFVGAEVFIRMTYGIIFYETGKIYITLIFSVAMLVSKERQLINVNYLFYMLLIILGIAFTDVPKNESIAKAISFNLSGPIALGFASIYLYKRRISGDKLMQILYYSLLPIFSMVSYIYFFTPEFSQIEFRGAANFDTSGGFGPNQVTTILGYGMFVIVVMLTLNQKLTGSKIADILILIYFTYRSLLTFSRGGVMAAVGCIFLFLFFYMMFMKIGFTKFSRFVFIGTILIFAAWTYTSNITGGMLENRYAGKNATGVKKADITSGRTDILKYQIESFAESPIFGIGVGNGKYKRRKAGGATAISHNEIGRLIEEHGLVGLLIFVLLFFLPWKMFSQSNLFQKAFLLSFYSFWFLTINHSAMRIAFPAFMYAMSLIIITDDDE